MPDLRYALRSLSRARGFAFAVVLTLGLGIGANTAIFSIVRGVLLRPLPHRDGDRLVYVRHTTDASGGDVKFSVPEILDFRNGARTLGGIAEYSPIVYTLETKQEAVRMNVGLVTGNYFKVMGLTQVLGRLLDDGDDGPSVPPVMVLTHEYWMKRFGGDRSVVGKRVRLGGKAVTVVGVVQAAPYFPTRMDALMNMVMSEHHLSATMVHGRAHRMSDMVARLTPGATVEQAQAELSAIRSRAQAEHPEAYDAGANHRVEVIPFQQVFGERARLTIYLLMAAAAFVMIISCANVANLTLMRGVRREHELVLRAALGAGAARLRRLLLVENLLLAFMGAALGLVLALGGVRLLIALAERYSPRAGEIRLDGMVLGFALALSVVVALLLSFVPQLVKEGALSSWLSAGASRVSGSLRRQRLQRALVVSQVAVSVVLLTGAGLLTRTMLQLSQVQTGLETEHVLTMEVPFDYESRKDVDAKAFFARMRREIAALPGVTEVGVGSAMPLKAAMFQLDVKAQGRAVRAGEPIPNAEFRTASPEYFRAAGIPVVSGRPFTSTDHKGSPLVVVLNKTLAACLFPDRDPLGQRIAWTGDVLRFIGISGEWRTVVGVVGDTKDGGPDAAPRGVVFLPLEQEPLFGGGLVIRTQQDPEALARAATRIVRSVVPQDPIENVLTVQQIRDQSVAPRRLNAVLVSSFGILAVIIAAVGIAGVLAFSVSARTNEIGIRMSLGANAGRVQRMVLGEGGRLLALGLVLGVSGSLFASRLIRGLLFGVAPYDPITLVSVAVLMAAVGIGACWVPALRAARIDPAIALRRQ